jgi:pyridinium-3,5-bisthiocarboxylic acid mononucleotide nickel chelatase
MPIAILHPFSGISGDMTLGALIAVGLDPEWLRALPARLGIEGISTDIRDVKRAGLACTKVDFQIPPQPHGRHLKHIREIVVRSDAPERVKQLADAAFTLIAEQEAAIHAANVDRVHLHEVGAVDAILDIVGSIWGFELLGVTEIFCGAIATGDGVVSAAHGTLPVPAPATMRLLEGHVIRTGPAGAGELVTPTGAALVRVLSRGPEPDSYIPRRSGFGAGTKEFPDRANALRIVLADVIGDGQRIEEVHMLACEVTTCRPSIWPRQPSGFGRAELSTSCFSPSS